MKDYRETIDPNSPNIVLFSPQGGPAPYWAESGYVADAATKAKLPVRDTVWTSDSQTLTAQKPVTLTYDNGAGLIFHRMIAVDDRYMFTVTNSVENKSGEPVVLHPYALILRRGKPDTSGYSVLHEGYVGGVGDNSIQEVTYAKIDPAKPVTMNGAGGWLGFTDKYWASAIIPDQAMPVDAHFSVSGAVQPADYQTDFIGDARRRSRRALRAKPSRMSSPAPRRSTPSTPI